MAKKVFYSWQSDNPKDRQFLLECLKIAVENTEYEIDSAVRDATGAVDISKDILGRIDLADLVVAEISLINTDSNYKRLTPNPNVMFEVGYAVSRDKNLKGVILVANKLTTKDTNLPFDVRNRLTVYEDFSNDKKQELADELKRIITSTESRLVNNSVEETPYIYVGERGHSNGKLMLKFHNEDDKSFVLSQIELAGFVFNMNHNLKHSSATDVEITNEYTHPLEFQTNRISFVVRRQSNYYRISQEVFVSQNPGNKKYSFDRVTQTPEETYVLKGKPLSVSFVKAYGSEPGRTLAEYTVNGSPATAGLSSTLIGIWSDHEVEVLLRTVVSLFLRYKKLLGEQVDGVVLKSDDARVNGETLPAYQFIRQLEDHIFEMERRK